MKIEYKYDFATEEETIEVNEKVYAMLKEADRLEHNNTQTYRRWIHSLDAYGFEPEFMAVEDDVFKEEPPPSSAYQYAMRHLRPKHQDILTRRLVQGEQFSKIAQAYKTSITTVHHAFCNAKERFSHHYNDGLFIFSKENTSLPEADRIRDIPYGLTPDLVKEIRKLRCENKTLDTIAEMLGVPTCRVKSCLRQNPITETKCLNCGKPLKQIDRGVLKNFCGRKCYKRCWYR